MKIKSNEARLMKINPGGGQGGAVNDHSVLRGEDGERDRHLE